MGGEAPRTAPSTYPVLAERPVGQHIRSIYKERLRQFTDNGQYSKHNLVAYDLPFILMIGLALYCYVYLVPVVLHMLLRCCVLVSSD